MSFVCMRSFSSQCVRVAQGNRSNCQRRQIKVKMLVGKKRNRIKSRYKRKNRFEGEKKTTKKKKCRKKMGNDTRTSLKLQSFRKAKWAPCNTGWRTKREKITCIFLCWSTPFFAALLQLNCACAPRALYIPRLLGCAAYHCGADSKKASVIVEGSTLTAELMESEHSSLANKLEWRTSVCPQKWDFTKFQLAKNSKKWEQTNRAVGDGKVLPSD